MEQIRNVVAYKDYFKEFILEQPKKVQDKIFKIIEIIEYQQRIPEKYLIPSCVQGCNFQNLNATCYYTEQLSLEF